MTSPLAFACIRDVFGRLGVVFNNPGYATLGKVECTPDADARALFEVNFWGTVSVSRAAVRFFQGGELTRERGCDLSEQFDSRVLVWRSM